MKNQFYLFALLWLIVPVSLFAQEPEPFEYPFAAPGTDTRGVFGEDNRKEVKDAEGFQDFVRATAVMVSKDAMYDNKFYSYTLRERLSKIFGTDKFGSDVRFLDQPALANCTGFLIAPDILVTAGHCVDDLADAQGKYWVFDYTNDLYFNPTDHSINVKPTDVYEVAEVYSTILDDELDKDYAVIRLNRKSERAPYRFRTSGKVSNFTSVNTIGSPTGLPLKFSGNATVVDNSPENWFKTNIDAFPGNSGGPVFDQNGFLEGILVRGAIEYDYSRGEYTGDYIYDSSCDCIKTVAFENTLFNAGCQIHKITDIPYNLKILAIYENLKYAIENKLDQRFDQWNSYSWIYSSKYAPADKESLLLLAAKNGYQYAVENIFGVVKDELKEQDNRALLDAAYSKGNYTLLQYFLDQGIYPDVKGTTYQTLLQESLKKGDLQAAKLLVDAGADVQLKDAYGNSLLHSAAASGNERVASFLISKGLSLTEKNNDGQTPEKVAKKAGFKDLSKYLKKERKARS